MPPEVWKTRQFDDILLRQDNAVYNQNPIDRWMKGCILPFPKKGDLELAKGKKSTDDITICRLYQGLRFHSQREDGTNPTSIRPTKRNRSSNNNSRQKHQSESTFTRWRHRKLRHCSRGTTRGHACPIPLYHLSRLRA